MPNKWVVEPDYPEGHLVEMTPSEQAQLERDQAIGAAFAAAQAAAEGLAAARIKDLQKARAELAAGKLFGSLSPRERAVISLLLAE